MDAKQIEELRDRMRLARGANTSKFDPKLSEEDRKCAMALILLGTPQHVIKRMFGISSASISMMANFNSMKHYAPLKREVRQMGRDAFIAAYIRQDRFAQAEELTQRKTDHTVDFEEPVFRTPTKSASKRAGRHLDWMDDGMGSNARVEIEIAWIENHPLRGFSDLDKQELLEMGLDPSTSWPSNFEPGWYYRVGMGEPVEEMDWVGDARTWNATTVDGEQVEVGETRRRFRCVHPYNTSNEAYKAARKEVGK